MHTTPPYLPITPASSNASTIRRKRPLNEVISLDTSQPIDKRFHGATTAPAINSTPITALLSHVENPMKQNRRKRFADLDASMIDTRDPIHMCYDNVPIQISTETDMKPSVEIITENISTPNSDQSTLHMQYELPFIHDKEYSNYQSDLFQMNQSIVPTIDLSAYTTSAQMRSLIMNPLLDNLLVPSKSKYFTDNDTSMVDDIDDTNGNHNNTNSNTNTNDTALILYTEPSLPFLPR
jgi:hypothetical protein